MKKIYIISALTSWVFAQDDLYSSLNHSSYEPGYFGMFFGLIFVIALIYLTGFAYQKLTKIKFDNTTTDKYAIKVISSASLGQNKNLYVVKIENNVSLIGVTNSEIVQIKDLGEYSEN